MRKPYSPRHWVLAGLLAVGVATAACENSGEENKDNPPTDTCSPSPETPCPE